MKLFHVVVLSVFFVSCGSDISKKEPKDVVVINNGGSMNSRTNGNSSGNTNGDENCDNGVLDAGEECDGPLDMADGQCSALGFESGMLSCVKCNVDSSACVSLESCGNGELDTVEKCEGFELRNTTCILEGFDGGQVACTESCTLDTSDCFVCGDGNIDRGEMCDGRAFGNRSCETEGFDRGVLGCSDTCGIDTSACFSCGDGKVDPGEMCDGSQPVRCKDAGFDNGGLTTCNADCTVDATGCSKCGNGILESDYEVCDGDDFGPYTCQEETGLPGDLECLNCEAIGTQFCGQ